MQTGPTHEQPRRTGLRLLVTSCRKCERLHWMSQDRALDCWSCDCECHRGNPRPENNPTQEAA